MRYGITSHLTLSSLHPALVGYVKQNCFTGQCEAEVFMASAKVVSMLILLLLAGIRWGTFVEPHVSRVTTGDASSGDTCGVNSGTPQMPPTQAFEALSKDHALIRPYLLGG